MSYAVKEISSWEFDHDAPIKTMTLSEQPETGGDLKEYRDKWGFNENMVG